ncbi:WXG100 family type VII secretion target [Kitasatospora sp. A2-31]|uniref:WXG100 family type VII secretion target n=1 Tax=Kitasatospora sp. A2-31 TaxID=2916414 RepID=UPI001EEA5ABB|nr:WXG100 family type VII secretion target [Kitasatospora sp. A2-31]MCG6495633.1 WXG100 family type VII secretion target [Kitasatospora sp. A2-31]
MADRVFSVDTEKLAAAAPQVQELAGLIRSVGTRLEARLGELGACWGDDYTGREFHQQYGQPKERLTEAIDGTAEVLDSTVDGIGTMAKGLRRTEEQNVEALRPLAAGVGELSGGDGPRTGTPHSGRR